MPRAKPTPKWSPPEGLTCSVEALDQYVGRRRIPNPKRRDERGLDWVIDTVFGFRLGFILDGKVATIRVLQ